MGKSKMRLKERESARFCNDNVLQRATIFLLFLAPFKRTINAEKFMSGPALKIYELPVTGTMSHPFANDDRDRLCLCQSPTLLSFYVPI